LVRSRYAEDKLEAAIRRGVGQYVIIGAGFDSFALRRRDLAHSLLVFELDHPATQQTKIRRLTQLGLAIPNNVQFVPMDFEKEDLCTALQQSRYQSQRPTFFSWLGTTHYLSKAAILSTLESLVACSAPDSEVVFDYSLPRASVPPEEARTMRRLERFTSRRGEPLISHFDPEELSNELRLLGYGVVEDLSGAEQRDRYFRGRSDEIGRASCRERV